MKWVLFLAILLIMEIIAAIVVCKKLKQGRVRRIIRLFVAIVIIILIIVTAKFVLFPPVKELATTGEHQITSKDYWVTLDKEDPLSKSGRKRQVQVRKWYPVDGENKELPVIVASHGSCGTIDNNVTLYRELASYGYTVLALAHPGHAASAILEDGTKVGVSGEYMKEMGKSQPQSEVEDAARLFQKWMEIRMDDMNGVMDDYRRREGDVKFVALGHSAGGSAAYAMGRVRGDVVACIALESPCMYDIKGAEDGDFVFDETDYEVPLLNIYSDSSYSHLREWKQYKNNAKFLDSDKGLYTNIHYEGTGHLGLCDLSVASPLLTAIMDGGFAEVEAKTQLKTINKDCVKFLNGVVGNNQ